MNDEDAEIAAIASMTRAPIGDDDAQGAGPEGEDADGQDGVGEEQGEGDEDGEDEEEDVCISPLGCSDGHLWVDAAIWVNCTRKLRAETGYRLYSPMQDIEFILEPSKGEGGEEGTR
jgi:hypothetical protein